MKNKTLVIAPHPDDELIGVGGTIAKRIRMGSDVAVLIVTKGFPPLHNPKLIEKGIQEDIRSNKILGVDKIFRLYMPANRLEEKNQYELNNQISKVIEEFGPTEVFIPFHGDIHIDHKIVAESAMVAMRPKAGMRVKRILAYEVPSETGWSFSSRRDDSFVPNVYENISKTIDDKLHALDEMNSQIESTKGARSLEAIAALARYRGSTVGMTYAEAFVLERELR